MYKLILSHTRTHTHIHTGMCTCITLSPSGQLSGEQDVGQLTLDIGFYGVIVLLPVQVIKLDLAHGVSG